MVSKVGVQGIGIEILWKVLGPQPGIGLSGLGANHLHFSKQGRRFLNSSPSWEILKVTELVDPHALRKQMDLLKYSLAK